MRSIASQSVASWPLRCAGGFGGVVVCSFAGADVADMLA